MKIIRKGFTATIQGKCNTVEDILTLYRFGLSVESIVATYAKDNKLSIERQEKL